MPTSISFEKAEKDDKDPYADEVFTFVFTDVAETIMGVCNSDKRRKQFCADVTNDECVSTFTTKFVDYLKSCGFQRNVLAFVNGTH